MPTLEQALEESPALAVGMFGTPFLNGNYQRGSINYKVLDAFRELAENHPRQWDTFLRGFVAPDWFGVSVRPLSRDRMLSLERTIKRLLAERGVTERPRWSMSLRPEANGPSV